MRRESLRQRERWLRAWSSRTVPSVMSRVVLRVVPFIVRVICEDGGRERW
jgi:hypothetical protein